MFEERFLPFRKSKIFDVKKMGFYPINYAQITVKITRIKPFLPREDAKLYRQQQTQLLLTPYLAKVKFNYIKNFS